MAHQIQVSQDGSVVWVHLGASTVGRFSTRFGMDVHNTVEAQLAGEGQCLHCTHEAPSLEDWETFRKLMWELYGVPIAAGIIAPERLRVSGVGDQGLTAQNQSGGHSGPGATELGIDRD